MFDEINRCKYCKSIQLLRQIWNLLLLLFWLDLIYAWTAPDSVLLKLGHEKGGYQNWLLQILSRRLGDKCTASGESALINGLGKISNGSNWTIPCLSCICWFSIEPFSNSSIGIDFDAGTALWGYRNLNGNWLMNISIQNGVFRLSTRLGGCSHSLVFFFGVNVALQCWCVWILMSSFRVKNFADGWC